MDVTLAKIEEIDNHFIAWSSSVLVPWTPQSSTGLYRLPGSQSLYRAYRALGIW